MSGTEGAPHDGGLGLGLVLADFTKHIASAVASREGIHAALQQSKNIVDLAYRLTMDIEEKVSKHYEETHGS